MKRWILRGTVLTGILLAGAALLTAGLVRRAAGEAVRLEYPQAFLTGAALDAAFSRELTQPDAPAYTAWRREESRTVANEELTRTARVDLVRGRGELGLLLPAPFLGAHPAPGDEAGCSLDRETADMLFGSSDILGLKVLLDGNAYIVRGVFDGEKRLAALQTGGPGETYSGLCLWFPGEADPREAAVRLLGREGLPWLDPEDYRIVRLGAGVG